MLPPAASGWSHTAPADFPPTLQANINGSTPEYPQGMRHTLSGIWCPASRVFSATVLCTRVCINTATWIGSKGFMSRFWRERRIKWHTISFHYPWLPAKAISLSRQSVNGLVPSNKTVRMRVLRCERSFAWVRVLFRLRFICEKRIYNYKYRCKLE